MAPPTEQWSRMVGESLTQHGVWHTYEKLLEAARAYPDALAVLGYLEIVRNTIVRDFLTHPRGMQAVPRLTPEFLTNFERFDLSAQEGYLVSLIDGRMDIQKLTILSPFDPFTTLFNLARLQHQRAILVP
jgi:hypothetical protein